MQTNYKHKETLAVSSDENLKTAWHRPSVACIDIKRTLISTGSFTDGPSPTT